MQELYNGALEMACKQAAKAADGAVQIGGTLYALNFDRKHWHYVATANGEFVVNLNTKTLSSAKRMLREWLNS